MIIDTRASDYIRESLTTNNCVVVVGSPGSGKSSILHHVALSFVEKSDTEDYEIIPVIVDPSKVLEYHNDCRNQIFVIDNLCGKDKVNNQLIDLWKLDIKNIDGIINQVDCYEYEAEVIRNKKTKLLISCNSSIFESDIFLPLKKYLKSFICELSKFRLTEKERVAMLTKYALEHADTGVNFTSQDETSIDNFDFPLLCELSARKPLTCLSEIKKLFREPHKTITNDLRNIQKTKPLQFCAIVLCTIFNNEFNKKWLNLKYDAEYIHTIDAVNEVFRELNLEHKNEREHIRLQFDEDKLEWLSKSGDTYHFVHESIFNIASVICVESYTQCFINHATSSFLAERFELANLKDGNSLNDTFIKQYFNRLIRDLGHGITYSTFQNIQLKSEKYRKDFIEYCRNRELKFREILGNLKSINNVKDRKVKRPFCADSDCRKGTFCFDFHSENSPLIECALQGYDDMVELLLDMKCDANETDPVGRSPLFVASAKGHIKIVKRLVENDGHLKIEDNKKNKADITMSDNRNRTSLHIACEEGHKPVIEYLVQKGANISVCDVDGNSLLHMACVPGKREVVELLLKEYKDKGKETEIENTNKLGQTPIIVASSTEGHDVVKLLLQYNANIQATDNRGFTSLLTASMYGFTKTVQFLINEKAKILHLDNEGRTALFIACKKGHLDTVKVLIEEGKTKILDVCDWHHKSPFYIACSEGRTEIVKLLIENEVKIKADIDLCDENSKSPLHVACERSHDTIVQFLLENRAKMDTRDRHQNLPLHVACKVGNLKIVQLLYQSTSDKNYLSETNQWKETPLDIAQKQGHVNIVNYLENNAQK
ncbi:putative ankyrin repeat protein RF_0381 [Mytilus edulis]|uniref:putative ankyrin repeat protein RF_0381 n=1 Tax=Mytilus edulis TaxID=6550 RepID=UPI0039EF351C